MTAEPPSQQAQIQSFLAEVVQMKARTADIDVPGWIIGQPSVAELQDDLVIMIARSKPGEFVPFQLPTNAQTCIGVQRGSISLSSHVGAIGSGAFHVLQPGEDHAITPLEHPTKIVAMFFRSGVTGGFSVDSR